MEHRAGWLDPLFVGLSLVGYAGLVWIVLAPVLAARARLALLPTTALTMACVWGADLVALGLKTAIQRPRPFETIAEPEPLLGAAVGQSLPSGHASTSFAAAVLLAYLARRVLPGLFLLAAGIAFSRIYVGAHFPSDVLAGAALGASIALVVVALLRVRPSLAGSPRSRAGAPPPD